MNKVYQVYTIREEIKEIFPLFCIKLYSFPKRNFLNRNYKKLKNFKLRKKTVPLIIPQVSNYKASKR